MKEKLDERKKERHTERKKCRNKERKENVTEKNEREREREIFSISKANKKTNPVGKAGEIERD
jgi:hypothetical protein